LIAREGDNSSLSSAALQAGGRRGLTAFWDVLLIVKAHQVAALQGDTSCQNVRLHHCAHPSPGQPHFLVMVTMCHCIKPQSFSLIFNFSI